MNKTSIALFGRKHPNYRKLINPISNLFSSFSEDLNMNDCPVNGFTYNLNLVDYIQSQMFYFGLFDKKGVDLIVDLCKRINCRTALDIGANVGNHAIHLNNVCKKVYSFEPNDTPRNIFSDALRSKPSNIVLFPFGLSNNDEVLEFYEDENNLGRSSFVKEHIAKKEFHNNKTLEVKIGDNVITENGITNIDFIKIDVEGFEIQVLTGLQKTISDNQPLIDFEFNSITRDGFGNISGLNDLLPDYSFYGTRRLGLGLIKEKLKVVDFDFSKDYSHVIAVPKRFSSVLINILS